MKKRIFALTLAICLLLSLGACGEKEETKKDLTKTLQLKTSILKKKRILRLKKTKKKRRNNPLFFYLLNLFAKLYIMRVARE